MSDSLTIRNARLRGQSDLADLVIAAGKIADIATAGSAPVDGTELDAAGNLVTESFVNTHLHLDKVFTLQRHRAAAT